MEIATFNSNDFPEEYHLQQRYWQNNAQKCIADYGNNSYSFIPNLLPEIALKLPIGQVVYALEKRFGDQKVRQALNFENKIDSPICNNINTDWIKKVNMVGINVRTIGSFWKVINYALTLPNYQSSIHLLPIWECGVAASLYGMASWYINPEFFDEECARQYPHLNTVEKQLKVVLNLLHLMGKTVGLDVVPHTDRYSEITLANPHYFEWLQRKDFQILDHSDGIIEKVQNLILAFVIENNAASGDYFARNAKDFFNDDTNNEQVRLRILFGKKEEHSKRLMRRNALISKLFAEGFEPVPATMAPPYRGLIVDPSDEAKTIDDDGRVWRDYILEKPTAMSRVFGPLARYKLYESKNNNENWELDFDKPRKFVFEYLGQKFIELQAEYNFDFMRGDMSHVQMNPNGTPLNPDLYYDVHKYIKHKVGENIPYFGYFAESFLVDDNYMAYGNEAKHLDASDADSTLGNLQSIAISNPEFLIEFQKYVSFALNNTFKPNFTVITADKDDPRFDQFFWQGNDVRFFIATFFKVLPSYVSLGFETRDLHLQPAKNEYYTKLYVFQLKEGTKSTNESYIWGRNAILFNNINRLKILGDILFLNNLSYQTVIISDINSILKSKVLIWQLIFENNKMYTFTINLDTENAKEIQYEIAENSILVYSSFNMLNRKNQNFYNKLKILSPLEFEVYSN